MISEGLEPAPQEKHLNTYKSLIPAGKSSIAYDALIKKIATLSKDKRLKIKTWVAA
jgi:hypothetical protein